MYNDNMDHENVIIINDKLQIPLAELAFRFATSSGPGGLEHLEAIAFGEQRWWAVEDVVAHRPRTIPYRMVEFIEDLASGRWPESPIDITPEVHHVEAWRNHDR